jgi:Flp pilus assembly protein TadD
VTAIAIAQFSRGRYEQAAKTARRAVELNPSFGVAQAILAAALAKLGHVRFRGHSGSVLM